MYVKETATAAKAIIETIFNRIVIYFITIVQKLFHFSKEGIFDCAIYYISHICAIKPTPYWFWYFIQNPVGLNISMATPKFELSGTIEEGANPNKNRTFIGRFILFVLTVIVISSVVYFPFLQEEFPALRKITNAGSSQPELENALRNAYSTMDSLRRANDSLANIVTFIEPDTTTHQDPTTKPSPTGTWYEIQIGAFKDIDLTKYRNGLVNLDGEAAGEYNKLTLGRFTNPEIAYDFLADVKEIGFTDAWVVKKVNGVRVGSK